MKRLLFIVLLSSSFCLPTIGQIRFIDKDGEAIDCSGGIGDAIFDFRVIYGRYPKDKKELLEYHLDAVKYESKLYDSSIYHYRAMEHNAVTKEINNKRNRLTVSGDTCSFYIAKERGTIQCIGGLANLQRYNYDLFQSWIRSRFYDKNGKHLWLLDEDAPLMPKEVNRQFRFVVTMEPRTLHEDHELVFLNLEVESEPVLISLTITRNGTISYELPRLEGVQLYYQELGKPFRLENAIDGITIEEVIDQDRLDAIQTYMKGYFDEHEEVDSAKLWELVLFNNPPHKVACID